MQMYSKDEVGVVQQQVAVLVLADAGQDDEAQLHVVVALLALSVLHYDGAGRREQGVISEASKARIKKHL